MAEFEKYTGPPFMSSNSKIVPITPIQRKQDCFCHGCKRTQIPLRLGWAVLALERTTSKAPGLLDSNVRDPGLMTMYLLDSPSPIVIP
jgi:hypothetical protein